MFLGHIAAGMAVKRAAPGVPLVAAVAAAQFSDLLWPFLVAFGAERVGLDLGITGVTPFVFEHYPYSHSLLALGLWGALLGGLWWVWRRDRAGALWIAVLVVSHWVLDWISHRPDMPLAPGLDGRYGLALWNSMTATLLVEAALFGAGIWLYLRAAPLATRRAAWAFWTLVAFLAVVYLGSVFGPPPPDAAAGAYSAFALWLLLPWCWWVERGRAPAR